LCCENVGLEILSFIGKWISVIQWDISVYRISHTTWEISLWLVI